MNQFESGTKIQLRAAFSHVPAIPADPTTITLKLRAPEQATTVHEYGTDPDVVREDLGRYTYDVVPDHAGLWHYRWEGTGDLEAAAEGEFMVRRSAFD